MALIDQIAQAALNGDSLTLRSLCQELLREPDGIAHCPAPTSKDLTTMAVAAALLELLALRSNQDAPAWTAIVGILDEPIYLVKAAGEMPRLRELCVQESPEPLRKRGILAPPNFLEFV